MNISDLFWDETILTSQNETQYSQGLLAAELAVAAFGTFVNVAFMVYILSSHSHRVSNSSAFAISLSLADCLVCSVVMVINSLNNRGLVKGLSTMELCGAWSAFAVFACSASSFNVAAMAVDRYICVGDPLNYYSHMPRKLLYITLTALWFSCFILAFLPLTTGQLLSFPPHLKNVHCLVKPGEAYVITMTTITIFLPCFIIVFIYCRILYVAYSRAFAYQKKASIPSLKPNAADVSATMTMSIKSSLQQVEDRTGAVDSLQFTVYESSNDITVKDGASSDDFNPFLARILQHTRRLSSLRNLFATRLYASHLRATILLSVIILVFLVHWLPFGIIKIISAASPKFISKYTERSCLWLLLIHSCWNPFIFLLCNATVRASLKRLGCWKLVRESTTAIPDTAQNATTSIMFQGLA